MTIENEPVERKIVEHESVLLEEAVMALLTQTQGNYVDATFGRGGHSKKILQGLSSEGSLLAIDKDPTAVSIARESRCFAGDPRFAIEHGSFASLTDFVSKRGLVQQVDGVLLDLGVSSPQLDEGERGFSFMRDGPLDMRMNPQQGQSAGQWLAQASDSEIALVLKQYGEERYARRIAKAICEQREQGAIETTLQLAQIVKQAHPNWEQGKHPATKTFQGIRIYINNELVDLKSVLDQALEILRVGGRLVVISFHSLEDRIVKRFIRDHVRGDNVPAHVPVTQDQLNQRLKKVGKAIRASKQEIAMNLRSRSAIMRVAEKLQ